MLAIFDCDGVLRSVCLDAMYDSYKAIAYHLKREPQEFWQSIEDFREWIDFMQWQNNLERMGMPLGSNYCEVIRIFHKVYDPEIAIFSWVEEILEKLKKRHCLAVLSAAPSASVKGSLKSVVGFFSHILGNDDVENIKPDPEGIFAIMEATGASPKETVMIGDTHLDIMAGKNASVKTIAVTWGMGREKELASFKPDIIINDHMKLLEI